MTDLNENNRGSEVIVGKIPKWINISVIIVICVFISLVIILSFMVPYHEIISADVKIEKIDNQRALGKMELMPKGYGMINIGQKVIVSLDAFPENIYGTIFGEVSRMSTKMNSRGKYLIEISIDNMNSSNGFDLNTFDTQLGNAKVVVASNPYIYQLFPTLNKITK